MYNKKLLWLLWRLVSWHACNSQFFSVNWSCSKASFDALVLILFQKDIIVPCRGWSQDPIHHTGDVLQGILLRIWNFHWFYVIHTFCRWWVVLFCLCSVLGEKMELMWQWMISISAMLILSILEVLVYVGTFDRGQHLKWLCENLVRNNSNNF